MCVCGSKNGPTDFRGEDHNVKVNVGLKGKLRNHRTNELYQCENMYIVLFVNIGLV